MPFDKKAYHKEYNRLRYLRLKDQTKERVAKYRKENLEKCAAKSRNWVARNKEKHAKYCARWIKTKKGYHRRTPLTLCIHRLRGRLKKTISRFFTQKSKPTMQSIGCSSSDLMLYIEKQFTEGMHWDNIGDWHIDHKVPLSLAKTSEEAEKLFHYSNLQPLWAKENLQKRDSLLPEFQKLAEELLRRTPNAF